MLLFLLKSTIVLAAMFAMYRLLVAHSTFHRANRIAIIASVVTCVAVSCLSLSMPEAMAPHVGYVDHLMADVEVDGFGRLTRVGDNALASPTGAGGMSWQNAVAFIYTIGIAVWLCAIGWHVGRLAMKIRRLPRQECTADYTLLLSADDTPSFSWGRYIVVAENDFKTDGEAIVAHELAHIRCRHSACKAFMTLACALLWPNPFVWLLRRELELVCEFEADEAVLAQGIDAKKYRLLLIRKAVSPKFYSLANSLNHSSLKQRLTMMYSNRSKPWARFRYSYVAIVAAVVVPAFAHKDLTGPIEKSVQENLVEGLRQSVKPLTAGKVTQTFPTEQPKATEKAQTEAEQAELVVEKAETPGIATQEGVAEQVAEEKAAEREESAAEEAEELLESSKEKEPQFEGGEEALHAFLAENLKYPEQALAEKREGKVFVSFTVTKDGDVADVNVQKGVSPDLDAEAMRVIRSTSGHWTPGTKKGKPIDVQFMLPISFKLKA